MICRRRLITFVAVAAVLAGSAASAVTTASTPVAGLATDQGCTRQAPDGSTLAAVPFRTDDLKAMTLPRTKLGSGLAGYQVDWLNWGYLDNAELFRMQRGPAQGCDLNRTHRRITGFSRAYSGSQTVAGATHLFFSRSDAHDWLADYVAGMKQLAGRQDVESVHVTSLPRLGPNAVEITARCTGGCVDTWVWFQRGTVLGSVWDSRAGGTSPAIGVRAAAHRLATRIVDRSDVVQSRDPDRADAVMALSAGLPRSSLGDRYSGLVWDWFYGGCWDPVEARSQGWGPLARGMRTFCRAMYVPPDGTTAVRRVERVFNGGILYRKPSLARAALASVIDEYRTRAGRTVDGTSYGPLVRWDPGSYGDRTVGLKQRVDATMTVRAFVLRGRYLEEAALNAASFSGMTRDVRRWTRLLDARVSALLTTRSF